MTGSHQDIHCILVQAACEMMHESRQLRQAMQESSQALHM